MVKRLLISFAVLLGLLALADRGLAMYAANETGSQIRLREGLKEDAEVSFRGFPFASQAIRGRFRQIDVTVRDLERSDVVIDRIDATLRNVEVDLGDALKGRVQAVPVESGTATLRITYGDLNTWLASRPGGIRIVVREGKPYVVSSFGVPNAGQIDVEGTPSVRVTDDSVRVSVTGVHPVTGSTTLNEALARTAGARASFTLSLDELPFGIDLTEAELTEDALVVDATATGLIIDVSR